MIDLILNTLYVLGAWLTIGALAVCVVALFALSESKKRTRSGSILTGCHIDDRDEMVTRRFVTAEEIDRHIEDMRPPLYDDHARLN